VLRLIGLLLLASGLAAAPSRSRPTADESHRPAGRWHPLPRVHELPGYSWATPRLLRSWIYDGAGIAHSKVRGVVLIDLDALDRLIEDGRRTKGGTSAS
jgi:hypothetical protein